MKIGIITVHRHYNYGSALQAWALQKVIEKMCPGATVEFIDYKYPNKFHKDNLKRSLLYKIKKFAWTVRDYFFRRKFVQEKRFRDFQKNYLRVSQDSYPDYESLEQNPPIYDLYVTGSDQVWNPVTLKNDPAFYCAFTSSGRKIAYSASFTIDKFPPATEKVIRNWVQAYSYIGIRERSGLNILQQLNLGDDVVVQNTCDPTLLLSDADYAEVYRASRIKVDTDYILVYNLNYAFNNHPAIDDAINIVQKQYNIPVIILGNPKIAINGPHKSLFSIGPSEFVYLFKHAKYVVTSSFHGIMFSIVFRKPFVAIVPSTKVNDKRLSDALSMLGLSSRGIRAEAHLTDIPIGNPYTKEEEAKNGNYINDSRQFLYDAVCNSKEKNYN